MRFTRTRLTAALAGPAALGLALAAPAAAAGASTGTESFQADLSQLNDSGASGTLMMELDGTSLTVSLEASGLTPNLPHAQHLHGATDGTESTCPDMSLDEDGDGVLTAAEGAPAYGTVLVSLTTEGDTSPDSGLAVDRMPVADDSGNVSYERTFEVDQATADALGNLAAVQHGIDLDDSGEYDGDRESSLDPELPLEATIPADCGAVEAAQVSDMPQGGVETGEAGGDAREAAVLGGVAALAAAGAVGAAVIARRRTDVAGR